MKIGLICTNLFNIDEKNKTGSGIFNYILINELSRVKPKGMSFNVFASGASKASLPLPVQSVRFKPSVSDKKIIDNDKHIMFELALIGKAFGAQDEFDAYHINIGDGDLAMPFCQLVKKPILVTLHNIINEDFTREYFSYFKKNKNVYFISASDYQRKLLPQLNYLSTIYHGIDISRYAFDSNGGTDIMWAGRFIPGKGPDSALRLACECGYKINMFGVVKKGFEKWYEEKIKIPAKINHVCLVENAKRDSLVKYYQKSKLFLSPVILEEAFGLVFAEAMSCGTPVVTYARGSAPEIIIDGITGFLVNPSPKDIRGNWIIKKTGYAGLCEAVKRLYALPKDEYKKMRVACRDHAVENFSADKMAKKYIQAYQKIIVKNKLQL